MIGLADKSEVRISLSPRWMDPKTLKYPSFFEGAIAD